MVGIRKVENVTKLINSGIDEIGCERQEEGE
jgi:hypothetical protein